MGRKILGIMMVFFSTLNQMAFLFLLIIIGYLLSKNKLLPENAATVLSKLENYLFIPALMLHTFMEYFTTTYIDTAWRYLVGGLGCLMVIVPLGIGLAHLCEKDVYIRKIYTYGLIFSNFGFMGNAVVSAIFPEVFVDYLIFVLPFWALIYLWGVPALLIPSDNSQGSGKMKLRALFNPMFVAVLIGMILGLLRPPLPSFLDTAIASLSGCMSPVAMLLTGMTIARYNITTLFKNRSVYMVSVLRLLIIPAATVMVLKFLPISHNLMLCIVCALAMPLGLNTIVIPNAYGQDTSVAAGMTLISHLLSLLTIPFVFLLFNRIIL